MKFLKSLQFKYMMIILMALCLIQVMYLGTAIFLTIMSDNLNSRAQKGLSPTELEQQWHEGAGQLDADFPEEIREHFAQWKVQYADASMFWIDQEGLLVEQLDADPSLPRQWTPAYTAHYIKERYGGDPFTVIAFVGNQQADGFVVLELPRSMTAQPPLISTNERYGTLILILVLVPLLIFLFISYLFFRGIRKRLLQLQQAMQERDGNQLPVQIDLDKSDEIGQLEKSFNEMVFELRESRQREQEEEQLRRELIANLSHDLRTPLTKLRANTYSLTKEALSEEGSQAVRSMEMSIVHIDRLMENLMDYTLLVASRLRYQPEKTDILRLVKEVTASWYPALEKKGFEIVLNLHPLQQTMWEIDRQWMGRILDNLIQNVYRHASEGAYIELATEVNDAEDVLIIKDKGKGMSSDSEKEGAGIGLSIVDKMVHHMNLNWKIHADSQGTVIRIIRKRIKA